MLKIFALILPLYENLRNALTTFVVDFGLDGVMLKNGRILKSKVVKARLVITNTKIPTIGLNCGNHIDL